MIGFSRGVWLALGLVVFFEIIFGLLYFSSKSRISLNVKRTTFVIIFALIFLLSSAVLPYFDLIFERILDFDTRSASIGGRINAYFSLVTATFRDVSGFLIGQGAGSSMPGLDIPASSSPNFLEQSYTYMVSLSSSIILTALSILTYINC